MTGNEKADELAEESLEIATPVRQKGTVVMGSRGRRELGHRRGEEAGGTRQSCDLRGNRLRERCALFVNISVLILDLL